MNTFTVRIRWGTTQTQEETYDNKDDAQEYSFKTKEELAAFLMGIEETLGWGDYTIVE